MPKCTWPLEARIEPKALFVNCNKILEKKPFSWNWISQILLVYEDLRKSYYGIIL
jgi:hypothetical protein